MEVVWVYKVKLHSNKQTQSIHTQHTLEKAKRTYSSTHLLQKAELIWAEIQHFLNYFTEWFILNIVALFKPLRVTVVLVEMQY